MRLEQEMIEALARQDTLAVWRSAWSPAQPAAAPAPAAAGAGALPPAGEPKFGGVVLFSGERLPQASLDTALAAYHDGMA